MVRICQRQKTIADHSDREGKVMNVPSYYSTLLNTDMRSQDLERKAYQRRALQQAGVDSRDWLTKVGCRVASAVGSFLVSLGQRLVRVDRQPMTASARMARASQV